MVKLNVNVFMSTKCAACGGTLSITVNRRDNTLETQYLKVAPCRDCIKKIADKRAMHRERYYQQIAREIGVLE